MAGARAPTKADVQACLSNARSKGHVRSDWAAYVVQWMIRQTEYERRNGGPGGPGGPAQPSVAKSPAHRPGKLLKPGEP
jgi:hypothetical protein